MLFSSKFAGNRESKTSTRIFSQKGCEEDECDMEDDLPSNMQMHRQVVAPRMTGIYGRIDEKRAAAVIQTLMILQHTGQKKELEEMLIKAAPESDEDIDEDDLMDMVVFRPVIKTSPIEFMVSTEGGSIHEMFSIFDVMRAVEKDTDIVTIGMGKVCSAGILLLAAGTKGKRYVGKNCRLMIHEMSTVQAGNVNELTDQMKDLVDVQSMYHQALIDETNITKKLLDKMLKKGDYWFGAEKAVELGIADKII